MARASIRSLSRVSPSICRSVALSGSASVASVARASDRGRAEIREGGIGQPALVRQAVGEGGIAACEVARGNPAFLLEFMHEISDANAECGVDPGLGDPLPRTEVVRNLESREDKGNEEATEGEQPHDPEQRSSSKQSKHIKLLIADKLLQQVRNYSDGLSKIW